MASGADRVRGRRTGRRLALAAVFEADFGQRTADAVLERHLAEEERDPDAAALARELVAAVIEHRDEIDAEIEPSRAAIPGRRPGPDGPRPAPLRHMARCYTRPRRPGWPSPSGSSWHAHTVENRCDA